MDGLNDMQERMLRFVDFEGEVCGHQLSDQERKVCNQLVDLELLSSTQCKHCTAPHFRTTN